MSSLMRDSAAAYRQGHSEYEFAAVVSPDRRDLRLDEHEMEWEDDDDDDVSGEASAYFLRPSPTWPEDMKSVASSSEASTTAPRTTNSICSRSTLEILHEEENMLPRSRSFDSYQEQPRDYYSDKENYHSLFELDASLAVTAATAVTPTDPSYSPLRQSWRHIQQRQPCTPPRVAPVEYNDAKYSPLRNRQMAMEYQREEEEENAHSPEVESSTDDEQGFSFVAPPPLPRRSSHQAVVMEHRSTTPTYEQESLDLPPGTTLEPTYLPVHYSMSRKHIPDRDQALSDPQVSILKKAKQYRGSHHHKTMPRKRVTIREEQRQGSSERRKEETNHHCCRAAVDEVEGTFEDCLGAFDDICHAFTLRGRDIDAVTGRIERAKRQVQKQTAAATEAAQ